MIDAQDIQLWERSLASIQDDKYLDIARNFIGKIATPFHKPHLTKQLTNFFSQPDLIKRMLSGLNIIERRMVSAVSYMDHPTQEQLCTILSHWHPFIELQQTLVNLEERLLLIPNPARESKNHELLLNPLLKHEMKRSVISYSLLFEERQEKVDEKQIHINIKHYLQALCGLYIHVPQFGRNFEKDAEVLQQVFPHISASVIAFFSTIHQHLIHKNVILVEKKSVQIHLLVWESLLRKDIRSLQNYMLALCAPSLFRTEGPACSHLFSFLETMRSVIRAYPIHSQQTLRILAHCSAIRNNVLIANEAVLIQFLTFIGITTDTDFLDTPSCNTTSPSVDSDLTLSFSPAPYIEGFYPFLFAKPKRIDAIIQYELSKESVGNGFNYGLSSQKIQESLDSVSCSTPKTFSSLLQQWEQEFQAIRVYDGIILQVDSRIARIIDALPALEPYRLAKIGQGLYLFSRKYEQQWREILSASGISMIPKTIQLDEKTEQPSFACNVETETEESVSSELEILELEGEYTENPQQLQYMDFLKELIIKKISNKEIRQELLGKLERRVLFSEQQIDIKKPISQRMKASGFDYQGKLNLCKSAILSSSDLVELHVIDDNLNMKNVVLADALELIGPPQEALLRVSILPEGKEDIIALKDVFLIKMVKKSIFF